MRKTEFLTKKALISRTPLWAKNFFRITTVVTTAIAFFMAGTQVVEENIKFEVLLGLKTIDFAVLGFSKLFGITEEEN